MPLRAPFFRSYHWSPSPAGWKGSKGLVTAVVLLAGCGGPDHPPPPPSWFEGLPVSGSLQDAHKAGFTSCREDTTEMRCRRSGVRFRGFGPFNAALDLNGSNGGGGL